MSDYQLTCINRSINAVDFGIYQKFRFPVDSITPSKSLIWVCSHCEPGTSTIFNWSDIPLMACGKWKIRQRNKSPIYTDYTIFDPAEHNTNAMQLIRKNNGFLMEPLPKQQRTNRFFIQDDDSLVPREAFVGFGMPVMKSGSTQQIVSIIFEAQSHLCHLFRPVVDYYLTFGNKFEVGAPITEFNETNSLKLRFPILRMIGVLRRDNTLGLRRNDEDS
ncbi:MAG: hypothetical protein HFJ84_09470 [Clostridiales bacterium]|jgi:hypothetical protein|nr:hypothetical protein [Clostridiales bacterium]